LGLNFRPLFYPEHGDSTRLRNVLSGIRMGGRTELGARRIIIHKERRLASDLYLRPLSRMAAVFCKLREVSEGSLGRH
jgi:hypothetical protein